MLNLKFLNTIFKLYLIIYRVYINAYIFLTSTKTNQENKI